MIGIVGVYTYAPEDLECARSFLARAVGRYPFEDLVPARYPLRKVNAAMSFAEAARPLRVALLPWADCEETG